MHRNIDKSTPKSIAWLLPGIIPGSGGHRTIIEKIKVLDSLGFKNSLYFYDVAPTRRGEMMDVLESHFSYRSNSVFAGPIQGLKTDTAISTLWDGVKLLRDVEAKNKVHFIQDFEACFNPMGDGYLLAELAYQEPTEQIVLGKWLSNFMSSEFGKSPLTCQFGVDHETYRYMNNWSSRKRAVAFIFQPEKPRRAWRLGAEALGILKHHNPEVEIFTYGSPEKPDLWFDVTHLGIVHPNELSHLYNEVQVGLCISSTNPSRIPFEMMACGLPVVDLYRSNNLYDYPDKSLLLSHHSPESIAEAIEAVLNTENVGSALSVRGLKFVENLTEKAEHLQFVESLVSIISDRKLTTSRYPLSYTSPPFVSRFFKENKHVAAFLSRQIKM